MKPQMPQIFEGIPLPPALCMWCMSQNLPEPQRPAVEHLLMFNGPPVIVEVCARCDLALKGLGAVAALGRRATRDEMLRFYEHNGLQVSGSEEEKPKEEPREALAKAIEPPKPPKPSKVPKEPKALPAPRVPRNQDRSDRRPSSEHYRCMIDGCGTWLKRTSFTSHAEMHGIPHYQLPVEPREIYQCENAAHKMRGCVQHYPTKMGVVRHLANVKFPGQDGEKDAGLFERDAAHATT